MKSDHTQLSARDSSELVLLLAVLVSALLLGACMNDKDGAKAAAKPSSGAPPVHVERVQQSQLVPYAEGTAPIEALRDAVLRSEAAGRVVGLDFERGEQVSAGQLLLKLDVGRSTAALEASRAAVQQAEAQLAQTQRELETATRLAAQGSLAQQALDNARDAERIATAALDNARAQMQLTRRGLTEARIQAPFDGTIVERMVELGEYLSPATPVARLIDSRKLRATVLLDPARALDVAVEADVKAHVHARPGEAFSGSVLRVGELVDPMTRKLPVEVEIRDPEGRLRPGLVARFRVAVGAPREALTVDENAVFERFKQSFVFVVKNGKAERREVTQGETRQGRIEITRGLDATDHVITAGLDRVVDGTEVLVVEAAATEKQDKAQASKP